MRLIHIPIKRICTEGAFGVKYSRGWQGLSSTVYYESQNKELEVIDEGGKNESTISFSAVHVPDAFFWGPLGLPQFSYTRHALIPNRV